MLRIISQTCLPSEFADVCRRHHTFTVWDYGVYLDLSRNKSFILHYSWVSHFICYKCFPVHLTLFILFSIEVVQRRNRLKSMVVTGRAKLPSQAHEPLSGCCLLNPGLSSLLELLQDPLAASVVETLLFQSWDGLGLCPLESFDRSQQFRLSYPLCYAKEKATAQSSV